MTSDPTTTPDQPLFLDETTVALHDGELEESSWIYAWIHDTDPPAVAYIGATGLPPVVRAWLHIHDDDPDVGRVRAQHPELLLGDATVRAFQIHPDLDRQEVKAVVLSQLAEPTTPPADADPAQLCAHHIAAVLSNGRV